MPQHKYPVVVTAPKAKAHLVREAAVQHSIAFTESPVPEQENLVQFHFGSLDESSTAKLAAVLPSEAYAYSGKFAR